MGFISVCVDLCESTRVHSCRRPKQRPRAGATGGADSPHIGLGPKLRSSPRAACALNLSHLSSPQKTFQKKSPFKK